MRVLIFSLDDEKVFSLLARAIHWPSNQSGSDRKMREELEAIQDSFESIGKWETEEVTINGRPALDRHLVLFSTASEIKLKPEAKFDKLKTCWNKFLNETGIPVKDSLKVDRYLDKVPFTTED